MFGHRRSARRARMNFDAQRWESVCATCGIALARLDDGTWVARDGKSDPESAMDPEQGKS
jgi:hypothetical protein